MYHNPAASGVFGFSMADWRIAPVGDMTTHNREAYGHFVRGHDLTYAWFFTEGIEELMRATEIDTSFALAYSVTACALSFAKQDSLSGVNFALATRHAGEGVPLPRPVSTTRGACGVRGG